MFVFQSLKTTLVIGHLMDSLEVALTASYDTLGFLIQHQDHRLEI